VIGGDERKNGAPFAGLCLQLPDLIGGQTDQILESCRGRNRGDLRTIRMPYFEPELKHEIT